MFDGETADSLALANTVILMRLIEELIQRGVISKPSANALLRNAVSDLENCPESGSRVEDAIRIIGKELTPRIGATAPVG